MPALPSTDIYQMGLMLWRIVSHNTTTLSSAFCKAASCTTPVGLTCAEPHADPVQLPLPWGEIPTYMKDIIAACRAEVPQARPSAWDLLRKFPSKVKRDTPSTGSSQYLTRLEDCIERYDRITTCDVQTCVIETTSHFYHCNECSSGNYDICHQCFDRGEHCFDPDHYLREWRYGLGEVRYHAITKAGGKREVIVV